MIESETELNKLQQQYEIYACMLVHINVKCEHKRETIVFVWTRTEERDTWNVVSVYI